LAVYFAPGCGSGEATAREAARTAAYVVQSFCSPTSSVQECTDTLLERVDDFERAHRSDGGRP
jgi:hypothetical protein